MWTPPINESAELTQGALVNSLLWEAHCKQALHCGALFLTQDIIACLSPEAEILRNYCLTNSEYSSFLRIFWNCKAKKGLFNSEGTQLRKDLGMFQNIQFALPMSYPRQLTCGFNIRRTRLMRHFCTQPEKISKKRRWEECLGTV